MGSRGDESEARPREEVAWAAEVRRRGGEMKAVEGGARARLRDRLVVAEEQVLDLHP